MSCQFHEVDALGLVADCRWFCHVLDARKSGLKVRDDVYKKDMLAYDGELIWRCVKKGTSVCNESNTPLVKRPPQMRTFIVSYKMISVLISGQGVKLADYVKMDRLLANGKEHINRVLSSFPIFGDDPKQSPCMTDYDILSSPSHFVLGYIRTTPDLTQSTRWAEYNHLHQHVLACYEVWQALRADRYDPSQSIMDMYHDKHNGNSVATMRTPSRTPSMHSPRKREVRETERKVRLSRMRQLALLWHDQVTLDQLGSLCPMGLGDEWVRELKVSIGSEVVSKKSKQLFV